MTVTIDSIANEKFTVGEKKSIAHLKHLMAHATDYEPFTYELHRVVEGSRKKPYSVLCFRRKSNGKFVSVM